MRNWTEYKLESIVGQRKPDGSLLLEEFLKDYANLKGVSLDSLQPSCSKCLNDYLKFLKNKIMQENKTESNYKLQKRYNGIPLKFGSSIFVTNDNITDEYAEIIIGRFLDIYENKEQDFEPSMLFEKYPDNWEDSQFDFEDILSDEDLTLKELKNKYPEIEAKSKKAFLKKLEEVNQ